MMADVNPKKASLNPKVTCEVCLREVPRSEAYSPEGSEYTLYFCGLDCYNEWLKRAGREAEDKKGN